VLVRHYVVLLILASLTRLHAVETESHLPRVQGKLADLKADQWKRLNTAEKRSLSVRMLDLAMVEPGLRTGFMDLIGADTDPFIKAHAKILSLLRVPDIRRDLSALALQAPLVEREVFAHYQVLLFESENTPKLLATSCRLIEFQDACQFLRFRAKLEELDQAAFVTLVQMRALQLLSAPFFDRTPLKPAFFHKLGMEVPSRLARLRMPLEAAILQERMLMGIGEPWANELRARIPFYLAAAGDFASALRYTDSRQAMRRLDLRIARLDWMILSGRYKPAVEMLTELIEGNVDLGGLSGKDPWTGFSYSKEGLRLRLAMVLHLAGDSARAARALEMLGNSTGKTDAGEPIALYAKIRLAQILLKDRPELAHKLAEDVMYEAQAQSWPLLEYQATVLDGWALVLSKQYFPAVVNFTKAQGILPNPPSEYSRLLGMMVAQCGLAPASAQNHIILRLRETLARRPYQKAIYTIREWVPDQADDQFFLEQAVANLEMRRDRWTSLGLLLQFRHLDELYFESGSNPGGVRGLVTSDIWMQTLRTFPSVRQLSRGVLEPGRDSLKPAFEQLLALQPIMTDDSAYLYSFGLGERVLYYLVGPSPAPTRRGRAPRLVLREDLSQSQMQSLRQCSACSELPEIRKFAASFRTVQVQVRPRDPDIRKLLPATTSVHYFYDSEHPVQSYRPRAVLHEKASCSSPAAPRSSQRLSLQEGFLARDFSRSIVYWPSMLDARSGEEGEARPVYLRNYVCETERLRFWDLDRFMERPPELAVVQKQEDAALEQGFFRFASTHAVVILQTGAGWNEEAAELLAQEIAKGTPYPRMEELLLTRFPGMGMRFVFPGPVGK
jgi:hypothetical protein